MNKHHVLKGTVAALVATAMLAGVSGMAYASDGKPAAKLAGHGAAQRIENITIGNTQAKNVILFIGDGMGDSEITVARDYLHGRERHVRWPRPYRTAVRLRRHHRWHRPVHHVLARQRHPGQGQAGPSPRWTDSAASGSAWATGTKTYNNALDVDVYGTPQMNLTELAKAAGKATGNVTTSEIQDATPGSPRCRIPRCAPAMDRRARPTAPATTRRRPV